MSEDGINSGARRFGRLCLALIPWALGIGASAWLGVWIGVHEFRHTLSQEERAAVYAGAQARPKAKIEISVIPHDCSVVTRTDIDGSALLIYSQNNCHKRLDYFAWYWQLVSPNGTVLKDGYQNWRCPVPVEPNDIAECRIEINTDDRTNILRVWTQVNP
jgi:hypothetical protein